MQDVITQYGLGNAYSLIKDGGFVVAILLTISVFATTLIIMKAAQLLWRRAGSSLRANKAIRLWLEGQQPEAYRLVQKSANPTERVLAHLMRGLNNNTAENASIREDIERVALGELAKLRTMLRPLDAVIQIAPLLGLFGTVLGMIEAFQTLQTAGSNADPAVLAGGIWVALLTTAVGLAVAIPVAFIVAFFESRIEAERHNMQQAITSLLTRRLTEQTSGNQPAPVKADRLTHAA